MDRARSTHEEDIYRHFSRKSEGGRHLGSDGRITLRHISKKQGVKIRLD